tara:strand:+ start:1148 stop:2149 length:1002 start_codon:yes stop_codon:yes gene_type:complete
MDFWILRIKMYIGKLLLKIVSVAFLLVIVFNFLTCSADISKGQDILLADPTILHENGKYYLYGTTSGGIEKTNNGFLVYESNNLYNWKSKGYALRKEDVYGDKGFWAPQVFKNGGKYGMVYTANENISIAFSDSPLGPFRNEFKTHYKSKIKQLDPFVFFDKGKGYLYYTRWVKGANEIFVSELSYDLKNIIEETTQKCIAKDQSWEDADGMEPKSNQGPSVIKINKTYYMFYSANNFRSPKYGVGYATGSSPLGPWNKSDKNPLIDSEIINQNGPGHGDIFFDDKKNLKYVFHTHFSKNVLRPRKAGIISLLYDIELKKIRIEPEKFRYLKD